MRKVLNLYAGLGGNRKKWEGVKVTAVEISEDIARVYKEQHPEDELIIGDAHEYLHEHYQDFDFIWSSPPCQSHSRMVKGTRHNVSKYPEMSLYQEIILLKEHFKGRFVVENVAPYYTPLIRPTFKIDRHYFWTNFNVFPIKHKNTKNFIMEQDPQKLKDWLGIQYEGNIYHKGNHDPCNVLRNCVHPDIGLHIYEESLKDGLFNL
jgi:DNA (cytosine-5)-methyltransferase 1